MKTLLVIFLWCTPALSAVAAAPDHTPFLPLKPVELVACMPPAPQGWTQLSSTGASNYTNGWVTAFAERRFKQNPPLPVPGAPPAPPPPQVTMSVHVTDTGYKTDFSSVVLPSKSGGAANTTYLQIGNYPARLFKINDSNLILDFLMKDRFLVEIRTSNLPDDKLKACAAAFDFSKLLAVPDGTQTTLTDPVVLSRVDEMNPQQTRSYPVYWAPPDTSHQ